MKLASPVCSFWLNVGSTPVTLSEARFMIGQPAAQASPPAPPITNGVSPDAAIARAALMNSSQVSGSEVM
ncbi:MAG: hypothetical protein OXP08_03140, partial [bacterium]|nr:hypothetical protein [bacterium]